MRSALAVFEKAVPDLRRMRNIGEHADEYALDSDRRHVKSIGSGQIEVCAWNGQTYQWLDRSVNVDDALAASQTLFKAVQSRRPTIAT